jgi:hypothetical protein
VLYLKEDRYSEYFITSILYEITETKSGENIMNKKLILISLLTFSIVYMGLSVSHAAGMDKMQEAICCDNLQQPVFTLFDLNSDKLISAEEYE